MSSTYKVAALKMVFYRVLSQAQKGSSQEVDRGI
jgi:hypothetical protein